MNTYSSLKYPQPKILLIDMNDDIETGLKEAGYNVSKGSFGTPYKIPKGDGYQPVIANGNMPADFAEQELIIVNLFRKEILDKPYGEKAVSQGENDWWASAGLGYIDPRPRRMAWVQDDFNRILEHGGIFIIFADDKAIQKILFGHIYLGELREEGDISHRYHNWSFLPELYDLGINTASGCEILTKKSPLGGNLNDYIKNSVYTCTLNPISQSMKERFISLAENKYCKSVACAISPSESVKGWIFIFPQIIDILPFIISFFDESLSALSPHLFPYSEKAKWLQFPEYEIPSIMELRKKINDIQEKAKAEVSRLEQECEKERQNFGYMQDLLSGSGDRLVMAVKKTFESLGFPNVIDVDEELKKTGSTGPKREDLRICDKSPILLIEVKGINGLPKDDDALQVSKYIIPRMKEWNRTDIQGLSIINHQKNYPPLERENKLTFRDDILANAVEQGFGLMTTWDLFRLTRGYEKNNWRHEYIKELFYKNGRINPIPNHYKYLGIIKAYADKAKAVGIEIQEGEIRRGDSIAFELSVEFREQKVESIQIDRKPIEFAEAVSMVGIETILTKEQAKKGVRVFKIL